jgi:glycosyltransferase involved in cell wall biosynthesis
MKVLHINGGGDTGGGKSHLLALLPELCKHGTEAELAVFSDGLLAEEAAALRVSVHCLGVKHMMSLTLLRRLRRLLLTLKPDIVHTHGGRANFYGRLAARLAGIPLVVTTVHSHIDLDYAALLPNLWFSSVDKLTRPLADHFIAVSHELRTTLIRQGIAGERISVVHNGIPDVSVLPLKLQDVFGLTPGPVLCAVGRLVPVKRFDILLRSMQSVLARVPECKLVIVGDGPLEAELKHMAAELNISRAVVFAGYRRNARAIMAGADVFVLSSDMEGLPIVLLEALAAKVPIVATAVGGIPEIILPQTTGLLVPPRDPDKLADAIVLSLLNSEASALRVEAGHAWFSAHATAHVMAANTAAVYAQLKQKRRSFLLQGEVEGP